MTPARKRRLYLVLAILAGVSIAGALGLTAFRKNVMFFFDPSQVVAGQVKVGERFRLGGMVAGGSVHRTPGSLQVSFVVTDFKHQVPVTYDKVLPDLFKENAGVVAHGRMNTNGVFVADEVLAKHDEKYMPPEVARSLKNKGEAYVPDKSPPSSSESYGPSGSSEYAPPPPPPPPANPSTTQSQEPAAPTSASGAG
jgi:cytochrome c-type biogenesis protein CcmE